MIILTLASMVLFWLIAEAVIAVILHKAPQGYEDGKGFHFGNDPKWK